MVWTVDLASFTWGVLITVRLLSLCGHMVGLAFCLDDSRGSAVHWEGYIGDFG